MSTDWQIQGSWKNLSTVSENLQIRVGNLYKIPAVGLLSQIVGLWSKPFHQRATNDALRFCLGCRGSDGWGSWLYSIMLAPKKCNLWSYKKRHDSVNHDNIVTTLKIYIYTELFYGSLIYQYTYIHFLEINVNHYLNLERSWWIIYNKWLHYTSLRKIRNHDDKQVLKRHCISCQKHDIWCITSTKTSKGSRMVCKKRSWTYVSIVLPLFIWREIQGNTRLSIWAAD